MGNSTDDPQAAAVAIIATADLPHTTLAGYIALLREARAFRGLTTADAVAVAKVIAHRIENDIDAGIALLNTARDVLAGAGHWQHWQRYPVARTFAIAGTALG